MYLVRFRIVAPRPPIAASEAFALRVALEGAVLTRHGVEHVRVHTSRSGGVGVLFLRAPDPAEAHAYGLALCAEMLAGVPQLCDWHVVGL
ncbi:hypothetical protein [Streptomyces botrytidirepellens]|uniref:Uncharacterized protein n=1 Tax=Streptomyces botrytidirepellens TaxID=2486417 RepID=A0A3M8SQ48_9ACTN|nr:hypothetical protein [Streptomyces botrytidirepellens]RNF83427.1 hypothetical protein EEJ42_44720 [Streptomyces botrytidirepellens]